MQVARTHPEHPVERLIRSHHPPVSIQNADPHRGRFENGAEALLAFPESRFVTAPLCVQPVNDLRQERRARTGNEQGHGQFFGMRGEPRIEPHPHRQEHDHHRQVDLPRIDERGDEDRRDQHRPGHAARRADRQEQPDPGQDGQDRVRRQDHAGAGQQRS